MQIAKTDARIERAKTDRRKNFLSRTEFRLRFPLRAKFF
jgi:hypothetical protein